MIASLLSLGAVLDAADFIPDFASARGIFCGLAWIATALAMVLTVASLFAGVEADGDGDLSGVDSDTGGGDVGIFSLRAIIGFFLGFGWGGFMAAAAGCGAPVAALCAVAAGLAMFFIVAFLIRAIYSLKSEHVFDSAALVGKTGTVYVTIPAKGEPGGQVQISAGQLVTMAAVQEGETPLPAQTPVVVTAASPQQLTVKALH
ncbi:MAG: hypothetical protein MJ051_07345 [Akkermansia sp.]|nr:hypothetical protein [Akkermansia sp.]